MLPTDLMFKKWRAFGTPDEVLNEQLLIESRFTDAVATATNLKKVMPKALRAQLSQETLDSIIDAITAAVKGASENDPTGRNAYLPWLAKMIRQALKERLLALYKASEEANYTAEGLADQVRRSVELVTNEVEKIAHPSMVLWNWHNFHELRERNLLPTIESLIHFDAFRQAVHEAGKERRQREFLAKAEEVDSDTYDVVIDDDDMIMVRPFDEAASCKFGAGTKWCTAATDSRNYFDTYTGQNKGFYYITLKHLSPGDDERKLALVYTNDGSLYPEEVYDAADDEVGDVGVHDAVFRNIVAKYVREMPFYRNQEVRLRKELKRSQKELKSLRSLSDRSVFAQYPWLTSFQTDPYYIGAQGGPAKEPYAGYHNEVKLAEEYIERDKLEIVKMWSDTIDEAVKALEGARREAATFDAFFKELAALMGVQVKGEPSVNPNEPDPDEGAYEDLGELYEHITEMVDEETSVIYSEAQGHIDQEPAGPRGEDFDKIMSQYDLRYVWVNEPEDYSGEGNWYWSAGWSLDLYEIEGAEEEDNWANDDDYTISNVIHNVLDENYIYPSEINLETYAAAKELRVDFQPDYDENEAIQGFERFMDRMAEYDDILEKLAADDWKAVSDALRDAGILIGESTRAVVEAFEELDLDNFQIDLEGNQIEIATNLAPTVHLPEDLAVSGPVRVDVYDYFKKVAGNEAGQEFVKSVHKLIQRELAFLQAQLTMAEQGIPGSPDFGEDADLEGFEQIFANRVNVNFFPKHDFLDLAEHSYQAFLKKGMSAVTFEYWFQIEFDLGPDGMDPDEAPLYQRLVSYLDQDRVYRWFNVYLTRAIEAILKDTDYEENVTLGLTPTELAARLKAKQERERAEQELQRQLDAPTFTATPAGSAPTEEVSEAKIFEIEDFLRNL